MIKALVLTMMLPATMTMAAPKIGTVAIYSDGQVEKLMDSGEGWTLWEDQRKRRYKKSNLPFMPLLSYQKFPDRSQGFSHELVFGAPYKLMPFGDLDSLRFDLVRNSNTSSNKKHWSCEFTGKGRFRLENKKRYKTQNYRCIRVVYIKDTFAAPRETIDLKYSPTLGLVVDKTRTDRVGEKKRTKLVRLLKPKKATAKRISRTVYKLRKAK